MGLDVDDESLVLVFQICVEDTRTLVDCVAFRLPWHLHDDLVFEQLGV